LQATEEEIKIFLEECEEKIQILEEGILRLERGDISSLQEIFRAAHTIKGSSGTLGHQRMQELAHNIESVLELLKEEKLKINSFIVDTILESIDFLKILKEEIETQKESEIDITEITERLKSISEQKKVKREEEKEIIEEIISGISDIEKIEINKIKEDKKIVPIGKSISKTVRIDIERLDNLMNLIGELVVDSSQLIQLSNIFEDKFEGDELTKNLNRTAEHIDRITEELQQEIMKARLLPLEVVFNKFPRMVRDLSNKAGKKINFQIEGGEVELDRSIIEEISDPLIHLLRNAIDHGIEKPELRKKLGKKEEGNIKLSAKHQQEHILITVEDDGRGISYKEVKEKAIKLGIISPDLAERLNEREILELIFAPGFSTKDQVSLISGRGVGMDIVKANIEKIQGSIHLETKEGEGTKFFIRLPLTVAVVQSLLVSQNKNIYAIPIFQVVETLRIRPSDIQTIKKKEAILLRGEVLPLIRLEDALSLREKNKISKNFLRIVVVSWFERKVGLIVENLIGDQEIVIKSLGDYIGNVAGISGASILGDGSIVLVLDISTLVKKVIEEGI
jgi:two-component system chemotaxis sensor kinase CheA